MGLEPGDDATAVSVVVASRADEPGPEACLAAIVSQAGRDVEVLVVCDTAGRCHPGVDRAIVLPGALVPELWAAGIEEARGDVVLLTAGDLVPDPGWVAGMRAALAVRGRVAVGGAIEPGPGLSLADWALYFCRYARYMLPLRADGDLEVAGDNAAYERLRLLQHRDRWEHGFWEPFVHAVLRVEGTLVVDPGIVVRLAAGHSARAFAYARFQHGMAHGRQRAVGKSRRRVLAEAATFPAVPPLMAWRAGRSVWHRGRRRGRFLCSAPVLLWFYSWWAVGELAGRLRVVAGR